MAQLNLRYSQTTRGFYADTMYLELASIFPIYTLKIPQKLNAEIEHELNKSVRFCQLLEEAV